MTAETTLGTPEAIATLLGWLRSWADEEHRDDADQTVRDIAVLVDRYARDVLANAPGASATQLAEAVRTGERMGQEAGIAAGYKRGLTDGAASAATRPASVTEIERDPATGAPLRIIETDGSGRRVVKRIERDPVGRIIRLEAQPEGSHMT